MSNINFDKKDEFEEAPEQGLSFGDSLYKDSWLDIVFKGRNKEFGAYQLRKRYAVNAIIGFLISFVMFGFATSIPLIFKGEKGHAKRVITMSKPLPKPKALDENKPLPPPPPTPPPPQIKTIKVLPPKVEPDEKVEEDPPTKKEMETTAIADKKQDGVDDPNANLGSNNDYKEPEPEPVKVEEKVELIVDEKATYAGNHIEFFKTNFNKPRLAQANGIGGKFKVMLTIDSEGRVLEKKVLDLKKVDIIDPATNETYGFVKEIDRVLDLMSKEGKWTPAKKGGKAVKSKLSFDLDFRVEQ